jgi:hypothetical protein
MSDEKIQKDEEHAEQQEESEVEAHLFSAGGGAGTHTGGGAGTHTGGGAGTHTGGGAGTHT